MMVEILAILAGLAGEDGMIPAQGLEERLRPAAERMEKELLEKKKRLNLAEALVKSGAGDVDYLLYRLGDRAKFGEDGQLLEGEALMAEAREEFPMFFSRRKSRIFGVRPGEGESGGALGAEEFGRMGYRQRLELFETDPDLYRSLQGENRW